MRYPNCVCPNFSRFNMIVIPKKHLEMIKKNTWRVLELVHWTIQVISPWWVLNKTGHSWKATTTSLSGAGLRPEGARRFWGDAAALGWERAKVNGERWQLNNKNDNNLQERWISPMKNGEFQKESGYLTVTWPTKKEEFTMRKKDLMIWSSNHWKITQKQDFTINHKDLTVIHWFSLKLVRSLQDARVKFPMCFSIR